MFKNKTAYLVLYSPDISSTVSFYRNLGVTVADESNEKAVVVLGDFEFHFILESSEPVAECKPISARKIRGGSLLFYIEVEDLEKMFEKVTKAGAVILFPPAERPWGQKEFGFEDPNGYNIILYIES